MNATRGLAQARDKVKAVRGGRFVKWLAFGAIILCGLLVSVGLNATPGVVLRIVLTALSLLLLARAAAVSPLARRITRPWIAAVAERLRRIRQDLLVGLFLLVAVHLFF